MLSSSSFISQSDRLKRQRISPQLLEKYDTQPENIAFISGSSKLWQDIDDCLRLSRYAQVSIADEQKLPTIQLASTSSSSSSSSLADEDQYAAGYIDCLTDISLNSGSSTFSAMLSLVLGTPMMAFRDSHSWANLDTENLLHLQRSLDTVDFFFDGKLINARFGLTPAKGILGTFKDTFDYSLLKKRKSRNNKKQKSHALYENKEQQDSQSSLSTDNGSTATTTTSSARVNTTSPPAGSLQDHTDHEDIIAENDNSRQIDDDDNTTTITTSHGKAEDTTDDISCRNTETKHERKRKSVYQKASGDTEEWIEAAEEHMHIAINGDGDGDDGDDDDDDNGESLDNQSKIEGDDEWQYPILLFTLVSKPTCEESLKDRWEEQELTRQKLAAVFSQTSHNEWVVRPQAYISISIRDCTRQAWKWLSCEKPHRREATLVSAQAVHLWLQKCRAVVCRKLAGQIKEYQEANPIIDTQSMAYTPTLAVALLKQVTVTTRLSKETVLRIMLADIQVVLKEAEVLKSTPPRLSILPCEVKGEYLRAMKIPHTSAFIVFCWLKVIQPKQITPFKQFFAYKQMFLMYKEM
jgi:hypothetical protein